jgi:Concanavalin A-like lectin/glucanases superfamily
VPSAPFTVEAWVRADDSTELNTYGFVGTWDGMRGYSLFAFPGSTSAGEQPNAEFKRNALPDAIQCATDPACQDALDFNTFRHLVGTYDPSMAAKLYIDGQLVIGAPLPNDLIVSTRPFALSGPQPVNGQDQAVTFDEVAVYSRALSSAEVTAHFNCGIGQGCVVTN